MVYNGISVTTVVESLGQHVATHTPGRNSGTNTPEASKHWRSSERNMERATSPSENISMNMR